MQTGLADVTHRNRAGGDGTFGSDSSTIPREQTDCLQEFKSKHRSAFKTHWCIFQLQLFLLTLIQLCNSWQGMEYFVLQVHLHQRDPLRFTNANSAAAAGRDVPGLQVPAGAAFPPGCLGTASRRAPFPPPYLKCHRATFALRRAPKLQSKTYSSITSAHSRVLFWSSSTRILAAQLLLPRSRLLLTKRESRCGRRRRGQRDQSIPPCPLPAGKLLTQIHE